MSTEKKCFIIQPLSDGYKTRCDETYKPAIRKAGLSPYRVDENYDAVKLKIEIIKEEIKNSTVCLADITEDNPNVWYEVGFADGHDIPVVFICEDAKRDKLPFDVNQRDIYFYETKSQGDWEKLREEITKRLKITAKQGAIKSKERFEATRNVSDEDKFGDAELFMLWAFYYAANGDREWREKTELQRRMQAKGFNPMDITDAFNLLEKEKMIFPGASGFTGKTFYSLTQEGTDWCLENKNLLRQVAK